jgi:hypothetical protein
VRDLVGVVGGVYVKVASWIVMHSDIA